MAVFVSSRLHSYVCCLLFIIISQASAQPSFLDYFCLSDEGSFTANSTYHTNLNTLLSNLTSNTQIDYGFYNRSYGENSEKVYGIGLCRGDVKADECRSCINNSTVLLTQLCPNGKEAIGWYDKCMLRYSNRSIFGLMETSPLFYTLMLVNATNVDRFNQVLDNLVENLTGIAAASGDSGRKYAAGNATATNLETSIYSVAQCTPDLSEQDCNRCLVDAFSSISSSGKISGRVATPSCNIRYETFLFYDEPSTTADAPAPAPSL